MVSFRYIFLSMRACDIVYDSMSNLSTWTELANIEALPYMYSGVDHFRNVWERSGKRFPERQRNPAALP